MAAPLSVGWTTNPKAAVSGFKAAHPFAWWVRLVAPVLFLVAGVAKGDPVGIVMGVATYLLLTFSMSRQLGPAARGEVDHLLVATDDDVTVDGATKPWKAFSSATRRGGHWVLRLNRAIAVAVPVAAFDEHEATRFVDLLRAKGLLK